MAKTVVFITLVLSVAFVGTSLAGDCSKLWPYVLEAKDAVVANFVQYRIEAIEREVGNLVFWDSYIQIQCGGAGVAETPMLWLSATTAATELTPYVAGFLFWLENLKRCEDLDISPGGLVRGRSFD